MSWHGTVEVLPSLPPEGAVAVWFSVSPDGLEGRPHRSLACLTHASKAQHIAAAVTLAFSEQHAPPTTWGRVTSALPQTMVTRGLQPSLFLFVSLRCSSCLVPGSWCESRRGCPKDEKDLKGQKDGVLCSAGCWFLVFGASFPVLHSRSFASLRGSLQCPSVKISGSLLLCLIRIHQRHRRRVPYVSSRGKRQAAAATFRSCVRLVEAL